MAETRMARFFYAMHRLLCLLKSLLATVHSAKWESPKNKEVIMLQAVDDIKNNVYWKRVYSIMHAIWSVLKILRIADSNKPGMDKIYYLTHRTSPVLEKSNDSHDDVTLFLSLEGLADAEADAIYFNSEDEENFEDEEDALEEEVVVVDKI